MTSEGVSAIPAEVWVGYSEISTTTIAMGRKVEKGQSSSGSNAVLELDLTKCTIVDCWWDYRQVGTCFASTLDYLSVAWEGDCLQEKLACFICAIFVYGG